MRAFGMFMERAFRATASFVERNCESGDARVSASAVSVDVRHLSGKRTHPLRYEEQERTVRQRLIIRHNLRRSGAEGVQTKNTHL